MTECETYCIWWPNGSSKSAGNGNHKREKDYIFYHLGSSLFHEREKELYKGFVTDKST
jgi:hypothetical protein